MVAREAVAARFGATVESNLDMVCAILSRSVEVRVTLAVGLVHRAQDIAVTVEEVQDESAIRLRLFFPENVPMHLDTLELADLRSSVEGFDTHLIDVRIDGEARTVTYDMLRTDVDCQIARGRGVFHSAGGHVFSCGDPTGTRDARESREARDARDARDVRDFVGTDEMRRLTSLLSKEQVDCVLEVRRVGVLRSDCNSPCGGTGDSHVHRRLRRTGGVRRQRARVEGATVRGRARRSGRGRRADLLGSDSTPHARMQSCPVRRQEAEVSSMSSKGRANVIRGVDKNTR